MTLRRFTFILLCFFAFTDICLSASLDVRICPGTREGSLLLSIHAEQEPLQNILKQIARNDIAIHIDPEINPSITASFENRDIQTGLESILKPLNYALIWKSIEGSDGRMVRLAEIQVFRPGKKERKPSGSGLNIARNPKNGSFFVNHEILLRLKPGITFSEFEKLLGQFGGIVIDSNPLIGIYRISVPEDMDVFDLVERLTKQSSIAKAEPNYAYPISTPQQHFPSDLPPLDASKQILLPGTPPVAILDSGLITNSLPNALVTASLNAYNPDESVSDSLGHGTQMAMIGAGIVKPYGTSPDSIVNPVIPIKAFDENGFTSNSIIMNSIDFALKNGARVMSLSWGSETPSQFLEDAMNYAQSKGLIVVAAAGNEPTGKPVYPAAYPSVIGVGALKPDGSPWKNSNFGDFVSVYAPGFATMPVGYKGEPGAYAGTSISAAYTAHVIADYLAQNPGASTDEVLKNLQLKR